MSKKKRNVLIKMAKQMLSKGRVSGLGRVHAGQVDLLQLENSKGQRLVDLLYGGSVFEAYRDLLSSGLCYVEEPSMKFYDGESSPSYNKFLATTNIEVARDWLGISDEEAEKKFGVHLAKEHKEKGLWVLKPTYKGKSTERHVTVPRSEFFPTDKHVKVLPVEFLELYNAYIYDLSVKGLVKTVFKKDNNQNRTMVLTHNRDILLKYYDEEAVEDKLEKSKKFTLATSKTFARGYVRVVEANASKSEDGLRSLNLARVIKITPVKEEDVDFSYSQIDLGLVVLWFKTHLEDFSQMQLTILLERMKGFQFFDASLRPVKFDFINWVDGKAMVFTTQFKQELYTFMKENDDLFTLPFPEEKQETREGVLDDGIDLVEVGKSLDLEELDFDDFSFDF